MKSLYESLLDDFDTLEANADPRAEIEEFLKQNFIGEWTISKEPNKDGYYEVSSTTSVYGKQNKLSSLTNGLFIWTKVKGSFSCQKCTKLTSLEGGPKEVGKVYFCSYCPNLETLKGGPKEVGKVYFCSYCPNLETLKGGPELAGHFICSWNDNLVSLEGGPKVVQGNFDCAYCPKLKSLKGAPEITGKCFTCNYCGKKFSMEEVKKYTKVQKIINI